MPGEERASFAGQRGLNRLPSLTKSDRNREGMGGCAASTTAEHEMSTPGHPQTQGMGATRAALPQARGRRRR